MARLFAILLCFASLMFSQTQGGPVTGILSPVFPPTLRQYLELTDAQVSGIQAANNQYAQASQAKMARYVQVQQEISEWIAKEPLDAMAIGLRYVEQEAIRRQLQDEMKKTQAAVANLLNDAQKAKLKVLEESVRLQPLVQLAQCENLLTVDPQLRTPFPGNIVPASRLNFNFGTSTGDFASFILGPAFYRGCGVTTYINPLLPLP
ncbi:MAG TPA: hypothetical protein VFQ79_20240 [Bryobacteraceae bacterium]|nr:hypothetical protein [Bryobacteraceae bacterium]